MAGIGPWQIKKPRLLGLNDGWLSVKIEPAQLPSGIRRTRIYGFTKHCRTGFTLSRFIGSLASEKAGGSDYDVNGRSCVPMGAFLSVIAGAILLRKASRPGPPKKRATWMEDRAVVSNNKLFLRK